MGAKLRLVGLSVATGGLEEPPVPIREMLCGLAPPVSVIVSEAVREPDAAGVKVTLKVQLAPPVRELPQLLDWLNSVGSAPVIVIDVIEKEVVPALVMTAVIGL